MHFAKIRTLLAAAALAGGAASASATVVIEDWGTLGATPSVAKVDVGTTKPFDDVYSFALAGLGNVDAYASSFEDRSTGILGGTVTLFSGSYTDLAHATNLGSFSFGVAQEHAYDGLGAGHYFFELTGIGAKAGGSYDFEAAVSAVPEPASAALLLAGIAMMGFVARRRS